MLKKAAPIAALVAFGSCRVFEGDCSTDIQPGIVITSVRHAVSGAPLPAPRGAVREGAFIDSLRAWHSGHLAAAFERPGTYAVEVVHDGYLPWTRTNVRVRDGSCHPEKVNLEASLTPEP